MSEAYEIEYEENLANGITSYKCLICGESFHDVQLLVDHHYATHISKTVNTSVPKDVIFVNSENQIVDENVQHFVYKCRLCTTEVSNMDAMTNHIDVEHNGEAFVTINGERMCTSVHKCVACSYEFALKPEMNQHFSSVHEFHRCNICSDYFPKDDLCHHKLSVHNTKPKMSYIQLIAEALLTSPDRMLALKDIYTVINKKHPYYSLDETFGKVQWQNCIRHNLTLHKGFIKMDNSVSKGPMTKGASRGALWKLETGAEEEIFKRMASEPKDNNHSKCPKCNGVFKSETSLKSHMCKNFGEKPDINLDSESKSKPEKKKFPVSKGREKNAVTDNETLEQSVNQSELIVENQIEAITTNVTNSEIVKKSAKNSNFYCPSCGSSNQTARGLRQHISLVHETSLKSHMCKSIEENFHCQQCNESFRSNFQLSTHFEVFHKSILLQREIGEYCTMEASTQSSTPHLMMDKPNTHVENYLEENVVLDSQIQSQGSLNENLQANQITRFEKLEKEKRETPKGRVNVEEKEYFDLPYGWTKEVVTIRNQPSMKGKVRTDIYLIHPGNKGRKIKTDNQLHSFLEENPNILCDLEVTSTKLTKHRELDLEMQKTKIMEEQHMRSICPEIKISDLD